MTLRAPMVQTRSSFAITAPASSKGSSGVFKLVFPSRDSHSQLLCLSVPSLYVAFVEANFFP